jgi:hypothetical protein
MSKKKHQQARLEQAQDAGGPASNHEYAVVGHDLVRVIVLNIIYLAGILVLYYTNRNTHYLENFFSRVFHW